MAPLSLRLGSRAGLEGNEACRSICFVQFVVCGRPTSRLSILVSMWPESRSRCLRDRWSRAGVCRGASGTGVRRGTGEPHRGGMFGCRSQHDRRWGAARELTSATSERYQQSSVRFYFKSVSDHADHEVDILPVSTETDTIVRSPRLWPRLAGQWSSVESMIGQRPGRTGLAVFRRCSAPCRPLDHGSSSNRRAPGAGASWSRADGVQRTYFSTFRRGLHHPGGSNNRWPTRARNAVTGTSPP